MTTTTSGRRGGQCVDKTLVMLTHVCCAMAALTAPITGGSQIPGSGSTSVTVAAPGGIGKTGSNLGLPFKDYNRPLPVDARGNTALVCYNYALDCAGRSDRGRNVRCDGDEMRLCEPEASFNNYGYTNTFCKIFWHNYTVVLKGCHTERNVECRRRPCIASAMSNRREGFCCCNESLCNTDVLLLVTNSHRPARLQHVQLSTQASTDATATEPYGHHTAGPQHAIMATSSFTPDAVSSNNIVASPQSASVVTFAAVWPASMASAVFAVCGCGALALWLWHSRAAALRSTAFGTKVLEPMAEGVVVATAAAQSDDDVDLRKFVKPIAKLSEGRFGVAWKATVLRSPYDAVSYAVAKVISQQHRQLWEAERDFYTLVADLRHENVARYIGSADYSHETGPTAGLWIVTVFCDGGSLYDHLSAHTLSVVDTCRIAHGTAAGLAFLHEFGQSPAQPLSGKTRAANEASSSIKPSVAHRDLKSSNVLLTADLTPRIADFGFAVHFDPLARDNDSGGFRFGPKLQLVGTLRYLAPEVLDGAVEFTREALLQCDVYSFGLVLWELLSRTSFEGNTPGDATVAADCVPVAAPPLYARPLELELGLQPTLADMREAVAVRHVRPRLEPSWMLHRVASRLCDTAVECWDADPAARVTSCCAEQRLRALMDTIQN